MDKKASPGIAFQHLHLLDCELGRIVPDAELQFEVGIEELRRQYTENGSKLLLEVGFNLMHGVVNPAFKFRCSYRATYHRPAEASMSWEEFKDHIAVAHVLPFLREFVVNLTIRMPLPALMIPPTNAHRLVEEFRTQQAAAAVTDSVPAR